MITNVAHVEQNRNEQYYKLFDRQNIIDNPT